MPLPFSTTKNWALVALFVAVGGGWFVWEEVEAVSSSRSAMRGQWQRHRKECLQTPISEYRKDRSRALRGVVRNSSGEPVSGAAVRCLSLPVLLDFVSQRKFSPEGWKDLVEAETQTDADGQYTFPYLDVGTRMICIDAEGYAPAAENMVTVQDGMGPRVDVYLEPPRGLKVTIDQCLGEDCRVCLIPHQWWPETITSTGVDGVFRFDRLGGAFRKGVVMVSSPADEADWVPRALYDLDNTNEVVVALDDQFEHSPQDLPEFASLQFSPSTVDAATRQFYSLMSPMAMAWNLTGSHSGDVESETVKTGDLTGFSGGPFLPVLFSPAQGASYIAISSQASEYELTGVSVGMYRIRGIQRRGDFSFARAGVVRPGVKTTLNFGLSAKINFNEENEYEIQGMVTWADGEPAEEAKVVVQDVQNFRSYLEQEKTDKNGFFQVTKVRPQRKYLAFATPRDSSHAVRNFKYVSVQDDIREVWVELKLHANRIVGQLPLGVNVKRLELVADSPNSKEDVLLWKFAPDESGAFLVENIPPGDYFVRSSEANALPSLTFTCQEEGSVEVRWGEKSLQKAER